MKSENRFMPIVIELKNAELQSLVFNGLLINGYTFVTTEKTVRHGLEGVTLKPGTRFDLVAVLSTESKLFLREISIAGSEKPEHNPVRNLNSVTVTSFSEKSVSLNGVEYSFSRHTELTDMPELGKLYDAVIYVTEKGKKYVNQLKAVEVIKAGNGDDSAEKPKQEEKQYANNRKLNGEILAVRDDGLAFLVDGTWVNVANNSIIDKKVELRKGFRIRAYCYFSPKGGVYLNKAFPAYVKKSA